MSRLRIWLAGKVTVPFFFFFNFCFMDFLGGSDDKESTCNARDLALIPRSGRSPGGGYGNPLQYSCLENSTDRIILDYSWLALLSLFQVYKQSDSVIHIHVSILFQILFYLLLVAVVQLLSHVEHFATPPWTAAHQASLSFTISWSLLRRMSIASVVPSNHLIFCGPLLLLHNIEKHSLCYTVGPIGYQLRIQQGHHPLKIMILGPVLSNILCLGQTQHCHFHCLLSPTNTSERAH